MKITLASSKINWETNRLEEEAKKMGVELERVNFKNLNGNNSINLAGDIIFWRSSSLEQGVEKVTFMNLLENNQKRIINKGVFRNPFSTHKLFQQKLVKECLSGFNAIPTFIFSSSKDLVDYLEEGVLEFPFIKKPNIGCMGQEVSLIRNKEEIKDVENDIGRFIFQNFIENDGDYRVLVIGGVPIGAIKRTSRKGGFLNNVSQGGEAEKVEDEKTKKRLFKIASQVATFFELGSCGVDIIQDKKTQEFYFLELNTTFQWQGFEKATGINVAKKILEHCISLGNEKNNFYIKAKNYYEKNISSLEKDRQFHFYSRIFLWTRGEDVYSKVVELKDFFMGGNRIEKEKRAREIIKNEEKYKEKVYNGNFFRKKSLLKFPKIGVFHELLFRNLMSKNLFGEDDLKKIISKNISDIEFIKLRDDLLRDEESILNLSTFAINYFYLVDFYLQDKKFKKDLLEHLAYLIERLDFGLDDIEKIRNNFYFLTHCIIGESKFYSNKISENRNFYVNIIEKLEKIIYENYFRISLDNKLEFLVCCQLVGVETNLEKIIKGEADKSFSCVGNFIIDKFNEFGFDYRGKDFISSEHRNALYIMANTKFNSGN